MPDLKRCDFKKHRRDCGSFFLVSLSILSFLMGSVFASGSLQAGVILPGQYRLLDHPDGSMSPPPYGLRMDALGITLSTELGGANVVLTWAGGNTATLLGTLWNNQAAELWAVDYTLTGVVAAPAGLGFTATGGSGSLIDTALNVHLLSGKQDLSGSAFDFLADGHRLGGHPAYGDSDTPVGRGWLQGANTNDWLVIGTPIPEPGTAFLLGAGLALLSAPPSRSLRARLALGSRSVRQRHG